jgi:hypothetical protein
MSVRAKRKDVDVNEEFTVAYTVRNLKTSPDTVLPVKMKLKILVTPVTE